MLPVFWLVLSTSIGLIQLLTMTQPEWVINGSLAQGLFVVCDHSVCFLRPWQSFIPFVTHFLGSFLMTGTTIMLYPIVFCSSKRRPVQILANTQLVASILMGVCIFYVPFDLSEIRCEASLLLRSTSCRVGWAYAASCICFMLSMCCPVLGRLIAEERHNYDVLRIREAEYFL